MTEPKPRRPHPSSPGVPGVKLPPRASVPPEERVLREMYYLEGRILAHLSDVRQDTRDAHDAHEGRIDGIETRLTGIDTRIDTLTRSILERGPVDRAEAGRVGELVALSKTAGGRRGALTGLVGALGIAGGRWACHKLGLPWPFD